MTTAPISAVIPALNAAAFIGEAIESVLSQTLKVAEVVVVDNGCSDQTVQIAASLGARIVERKDKRGISPARNAGIMDCRQEWIALLDADDRWDPRKIEYQWSTIRACPEVGIVGSYFLAFQNDSIVLKISDEEQRQRWSGYTGACTLGEGYRYFPRVEKDFFPRYLPSCSDAMIRRDVFSTVGLFDEDVQYNEDFEFFLRGLARFPLAVVEKTLVHCRRHDGKHSNKTREMRDGAFSVVSQMLKHPERYPPGAPEVYRDRLKSTFLMVERALEGK